jgi:hypothetical protein
MGVKWESRGKTSIGLGVDPREKFYYGSKIIKGFGKPV